MARWEDNWVRGSSRHGHPPLQDQNAKLIRELKEEINYLRQQLYTTARDPSVQSPGRRSSYSSPLPRSENEEEWQNKLEMSEHIISEVKQTWEERFWAAQAAFKERLQQTERDLLSRVSFAIGDLPVLVSLNPHPVSGEQLAFPCKSARPTSAPTTKRSRRRRRTTSGCPTASTSPTPTVFDHHESGEVEIVPLNGSLSYINDQLLTAPTVLTHGSRLVLGSNHVFLFVGPLEAVPPAAQGGPGGVPEDHRLGLRVAGVRPQPPSAPQILDYNPTTGHVTSVSGTRASTPAASAPGTATSSSCTPRTTAPRPWRRSPAAPPAGRRTAARAGGPPPPEADRAHALPAGAYGEGMPGGMHPFLPPWEEALFFEDLKQQLFALQFQLLNIRDAMFPPPPDFPDDEEAAEAIRSAMTREELENMERRRALRDDWVLTSKKVDGRDVLEHIVFLQDELRVVSSTVTQWMYQLHAMHTARSDPDIGAHLAHQLEEKDKALAFMQAQVTLLHAECGQLRQENQRYALSKSPPAQHHQRREAEVPFPNWSGRLSDLSDDGRAGSDAKAHKTGPTSQPRRPWPSTTG